MTKTGLIKAIITLFVALGVHFGLGSLLPGISGAVDYILSGLGGAAGLYLANFLHLSDPPADTPAA